MIYQRQVPPGLYRSSSARDSARSSGTTFWTTFQLLEGEQEYQTVFTKNGVIDTPFVTVSVDENITVYDKTNPHEAYDAIRFEDRGNIGNEYIYFQPKGTEPCLQNSKAVKFGKYSSF